MTLLTRKEKRFPFFKQLDSRDCGPTCLRMIAKHYGKIYSLEYLRERSFLTRQGVSLLNLSDAAEIIGMRSLAVSSTYKMLEEVPLPCIAHWNHNHFIVIYKVHKDKVCVADPAHGLLKYSRQDFLKSWITTSNNGKSQGSLLLLEPTPAFHKKDEDEEQRKTGFKFLFSYLFAYKKFLFQLFLGMIAGSLLQLILPFLTQSLVDFGINHQNIGFIYTILLAQLTLFLSRTSVDLIRSWILLHIGTRINISIISDFLIKLMKLPMPFFDSRMIGDIIQRIGDHQRIEQFLTSTTLNSLFSLINLVVFGVVLAIYNATIFVIFALSTLIYAAWIVIFLKKRRDLDYKRFSQLSSNQSNIIQLINGMQEIKLNNCEKQKRWEWEKIQARLFKVNVRSLVVQQFQETGTFFINELKNIIITFWAAKEVINGNITLGMMLSIQYIIGQLNSPINQLLDLISRGQDARISIERLGEIHQRDDEEDPNAPRTTVFPEDSSLHITDLAFQYEGPKSPFVLTNLNMHIPQGKVTAIVGVSGSGKTTLLKLLLKFYQPTQGKICLGNADLTRFDSRIWRQTCGVVMQEGYIFPDSIARNIALGAEQVDFERLLHAVNVANIRDFIEYLPLGFNTRIGEDGHGLSQGQRQRILIARAVYKDPGYILFDEATNALDANNERVIMQNLEAFFKGRTVIIVAHRLSTVRRADQIVVLHNGNIVEQGSHAALTRKRGAYYELVKNQLELGK